MARFGTINGKTLGGEWIRGELSTDPCCDWLRERIDRLEVLIADGQLVKRDPSHRVVVITPDRGPRLLCKFFPQRGLVDRFKQLCRLDRPTRVHRRLKKTVGLQVPLPPSLGHVTVNDFGSVWLCPMVAGKSLLHWAGDRLPHETADQLQLLTPVVDAMLQLHRAGFVHGDFKWGNVLYDPDNSTCWLVDVDGVRAVPSRSFCRSKARDVARFLLDCMEAGVPDSVVRQLTERYGDSANLPAAELQAKVQPILRRLQKRHIKRYGKGYRLSLGGDT